jgi:hypothetical protein
VARIAQAAIAQGKYLEPHERLFAERGRATKQKALRIASELGPDTAKLVPFYLVGDRPLPEAATIFMPC